MKQLTFLTVILLFSTAIFAQSENKSGFKHHEIKVSYGTSYFLPDLFWNGNYGLNGNFSVAYFYRPAKWLWTGVNSVNFIAKPNGYREYYTDGSYKDHKFAEYCLVIAPEVRFSYFNKKIATLYSALSGGVGFERCYYRRNIFWETHWYSHITLFGFNINMGKNQNFFLGGELGFGFKGGFNIHGGYNF